VTGRKPADDHDDSEVIHLLKVLPHPPRLVSFRPAMISVKGGEYRPVPSLAVCVDLRGPFTTPRFSNMTSSAFVLLAF